MSESLEGPRVICRICARQFARYTCPRCNARYCSLPCYKKHSTQCTEAFYRDNAVEQMKGTRADDKQQKAVLDILRRVHEQGDAEYDEMQPFADGTSYSSSTEEEDSASADGDDNSMQMGLPEETMQRLLKRIEDGAEELSLEDLSPDDLQRFQRAVNSGSISHLLEEWEPWWQTPEAQSLRLSTSGTRLMMIEKINPSRAASLEEADNVKDSDPELYSAVPAAPSEPLPTLKALLGTRSPSPVLQWHLLDILYAYCCTMRIYNGEWQTDAAGASTLALTLSAVLAGDTGNTGPDSPCSTHDVLQESVARATAHFGIGGGRIAAMRGCSDVASLVSAGRPAIVCALWDMRRFLAATLEDVEHNLNAGLGASSQDHHSDSSQQRTRDSKRKRKMLKAAQHKLLFFASWTNYSLLENASLQLAAVQNHCQQTWTEMDAILSMEQQHCLSNEPMCTASTSSATAGDDQGTIKKVVLL